MKNTVLKKNVKEYSFFLALTVAAVAVLFYRDSASSFTEGIKLWFACVLPSLFPYMFLSSLLSETNAAKNVALKLSPVSEKAFGVNGCAAYAFFISVISGYPIGAKIVSDMNLKGFLNRTETVRAAALCSTASPVFLIVSVGSIAFKNPFFGILLFITHILSALTVGFLFSFYRRKDKPQKITLPAAERHAISLYGCVENSVISVLAVGGIISLFYLFTDVLSAAGILSPAVKLFSAFLKDENVGKGVVFSLFECTKGLKAISVSGINFLTLPLCAAICGFGGLSVIAQSLAFLKKTEIKTAAFVLIKLLAAVVNFIIGLIFSLLFFL